MTGGTLPSSAPVRRSTHRARRVCNVNRLEYVGDGGSGKGVAEGKRESVEGHAAVGVRGGAPAPEAVGADPAYSGGGARCLERLNRHSAELTRGDGTGQVEVGREGHPEPRPVTGQVEVGREGHPEPRPVIGEPVDEKAQGTRDEAVALILSGQAGSA
jgi:hypothetical protein